MRSGTFGDPTVDQGVTYRDFLLTPPNRPKAPTRRRSTESAPLIDIPFTAVGYRGKELPVRRTTLTAAGAPLPEPDLRDQLALAVIPEDCSDRGRSKLWAPWPRRPGRYLVEVNLLDEDDELLDTRRTDAFAVPASRAAE